MDEENLPEPKTELVEIVLFGLFFVACDLIELIPIAGDVLDIVVGLPFDFYLWFRGLNITAALIDQAIELVPALQEVPLWTFTWGVIVYIDHHPKVEQKLAFAEEAVSVAEGKFSNVGDAANAGQDLAQSSLSQKTQGSSADIQTQGKGSTQASGTPQNQGPSQEDIPQEEDEGGRGAQEQDVSISEPQEDPIVVDIRHEFSEPKPGWRVYEGGKNKQSQNYDQEEEAA